MLAGLVVVVGSMGLGVECEVEKGDFDKEEEDGWRWWESVTAY